ncbi:hypothetical protein, partial [Methanobrevibacter smithii]|uniref:hypothetical protein n=1 Tax=Methanobrevibacter smithii TaxID=2173 RepID=UPI00384FEB68
MNKQYKIAISVLLVFLFVLTIASASATDIDVGGNGSDYTTVSEAVSNSQSGDNIYIETGNYNENNININHDLTISSKNSENVTINANYNKVFTVNKNAKLTLIGINFINGKGDGGSIIYNNGQTTIKNSTFSNCEVNGYGGVVFNNLGTLNVENSVFKNNIAESQGGFLHNEAGKVTITNSTFINNQATRGGAIYNHHGFLTIDSSIFQKNSCGKHGELGGAIINIQNELTPEITTITYSVFKNNDIKNQNQKGDIILNYNNILNSTVKGINIDASYNWWGTNNVTGMNLSNWAVATITSNPSTLVQNSKGNITVSLNNLYNNLTKTTTSKNMNINGEVLFESLNYTQSIDLKNGIAKLSFDTKNRDNITASIGNQKFTLDIFKIESSNLVKYYKNDSQFAVKTLANSKVIFEINGKNYTKTSDKNGIASMSINLRPGNYTMKTYTLGNVITNNITVLSTINGKNIVKMYRNGTQFYATFLKGDGSPLANTNVTFNINGVFYTKQTDKNGIAKLNINLRPNTYILTCIDPLTGLDIGYNVNVLPTIVAKSIVKTYLNDTQFHATLLDEKGNPVTNTNITFNIHGVFYKKLTNESGIATLNIRLIPGEYILTAYDPF